MSIEVMKAAGKIAADEISAITDVRGSDHYRRLLAENVFSSCFYEMTSTPTQGVTL